MGRRARTFSKPVNHPETARPTWAEIDLDALAANLRAVQAQVRPDVGVMAVVKANAYGHDAGLCARCLAMTGANWFGVALPEEAHQLREAGILQPILCLGGFWTGQEDGLLQANLTPVIYRRDQAEALNRAAQARGVKAAFHLKIDTGMGRLGVPHHVLSEFLDALQTLPHLHLDGVMTHFASADEPSQHDFTALQTARYAASLALVRQRGYAPRWCDLANSAGIYAHPAAHGNLVRAGGVLYGLWRDILPELPALPETPKLRAVLSLQTQITLLKRVPASTPLGYGRTFFTQRESLIATLPIGYNDGYPRALSNRGRVLVRGQFAPVVGRVSMDLTLVDVTAVPDVQLHDTVTLIGTQGALSITAEDIAAQTGTLSYEITCGLSARVPRISQARDNAYKPSDTKL